MARPGRELPAVRPAAVEGFSIFSKGGWGCGSDQGLGKVLALGAYLHGEASSHACSLPRGGGFCEENEAGGEWGDAVSYQVVWGGLFGQRPEAAERRLGGVAAPGPAAR